MSVRVKILDRQGLHFVEHILSHVHQKALSYVCHYSRIYKSANNTRHVYTYDTSKHSPHCLFDGVVTVDDTRLDYVGDKSLDKNRRAHSRHSVDCNTDKYRYQRALVILEHISQKSAQNRQSTGLFVVKHFFLTHITCPPLRSFSAKAFLRARFLPKLYRLSLLSSF